MIWYIIQTYIYIYIGTYIKSGLKEFKFDMHQVYGNNLRLSKIGTVTVNIFESKIIFLPIITKIKLHNESGSVPKYIHKCNALRKN